MLEDGVPVVASEVLKYQKIRCVKRRVGMWPTHPDSAFRLNRQLRRRDPMRLHSFYANLVLRSKSNLRICFDLDGTLVTDPLQPGDYTTVKPLPDNIGICRQLKEQGHIIIINTSRGMAMHHGALRPNAFLSAVVLRELWRRERGDGDEGHSEDDV